jgi:hypothetical protein
MDVFLIHYLRLSKEKEILWEDTVDRAHLHSPFTQVKSFITD